MTSSAYAEISSYEDFTLLLIRGQHDDTTVERLRFANDRQAYDYCETHGILGRRRRVLTPIEDRGHRQSKQGPVNMTNKPLALLIAFTGLMATTYLMATAYTPHADWVTISLPDPPAPLPDPIEVTVAGSPVSLALISSPIPAALTQEGTVVR
jgi:hypothetical protein